MFSSSHVELRDFSKKRPPSTYATAVVRRFWWLNRQLHWSTPILHNLHSMLSRFSESFATPADFSSWRSPDFTFQILIRFSNISGFFPDLSRSSQVFPPFFGAKNHVFSDFFGGNPGRPDHGVSGCLRLFRLHPQRGLRGATAAI